jgi:tRNA(Ile)-lysidine synthase
MQRRFADTMKELRGLINDWSAPCCHSEDRIIACHSEERSDVRILLAVSGGVDSMCMAELFASLEESVPFAIAHCNFQLRGSESDGDEEFVRDWAIEHDVKFHAISFDTELVARSRGISIEMAARDLRYDWFASLCREYGYRALAVAHNANDNAETLILNLLRGSGLNGLSGMSKFSALPGVPDILLLRPLLDCTRKQIEGYMFAYRHSYREDSTNAVSDYKRNRIRNEVFPIFEKLNPSFVRTINREMGYFTEAGEIVEDWCRAAAGSVVNGNHIDTKALLEKKHWKYLLYHILEPYGFNTATLSSIENLLESSRTIPGKRFESADHLLLTGRDELVVLPLEREPVLSEDVIMPVRGAGRYHFNGRTFEVQVIPFSKDIDLKQPEGVIMLDAGKLRFPFVLRKWRQGDWLIPLGMRGKKKVSDLFTDLKYGAVQKGISVMVIDTMTEGMAESQHVASIACVRIDVRYKISDSTDSIIKITEII